MTRLNIDLSDLQVFKIQDYDYVYIMIPDN